MRLVLSVCVSAALLLSTHTAAQTRGTAAPSGPPKLAVVIVVDQMRADYVDRFLKDWTGGLKRLVTEGARFDNAAYPYGTTVTCAGHATISTGNFPHTHGIVSNGWWDRDRGALMTCTEDPRVKGVSYGARFDNGDSAWRLQRPTFTDVMRGQRRAHVVTLSLKDRSAIMLAGHGGDAVTWFSESLEGWVTSSAFAKEPLPQVRDFVAANPIASDFGKTWSRLLPVSQYAHGDELPGEAPPRGWTRTFPHVLKGMGESPDAVFVSQWERSPYADAYVGRFAAALVDAFALGRHDGTDVLGVSFSTPDMVGHAFGPRSQEEQDLYAHLDRTLGALFDHLDATVGRGQWVAGLSADHGVTPQPEQLAAEGKDGGRLSAAVVTGALEQRLRGSFGEGRHVAQLSGNDLYFAKGVYDKLLKSPGELEGVLKTLREVPGIARVFRSEELRDPATAKDPLQHAAALSYFPGRSGDLILALKPGWMFTASGTTHGTATPDDQHVPLLFLGAGVKPGRYTDAATPADLTPTLAAIAGVSMPEVEGKALKMAISR